MGSETNRCCPRMQSTRESFDRRLTRRQFASGCAACLACGATSLLSKTPARAAPSAPSKPKIRLVFCETPNNQPIWPNIGYDFDGPPQTDHASVLTRQCPEVEFLAARLMNDPKQADEVLKGDAEVDGYLVCVQGLGWSNDIVKLCATGKPTLAGGQSLRRLGPVPRRYRPDHERRQAGGLGQFVQRPGPRGLGAALRRALAQGTSGADIAAAFRATRRKNTPALTDWTCNSDPVPAPDFDEALEQLRQTQILVVGGGWGGDAFRQGEPRRSRAWNSFPSPSRRWPAPTTGRPEGGPGLRRALDRRRRRRSAASSREIIENAGAMYVAMKQVMDKHDARGISINCLGGFYGGHLKAYPCLGFSQLNNDGLVGGCEADQMSALTMAVMGALTGRPGFISDPVIDTSKSAIVYAHCVATTKPFGPAGAANPYEILTHSEDRQGAAVRSLLPAGYLDHHPRDQPGEPASAPAPGQDDRQQPQRPGLPHEAGSGSQRRSGEADRALEHGLAPRHVLWRAPAARRRALPAAEPEAHRRGLTGSLGSEQEGRKHEANHLPDSACGHRESISGEPRSPPLRRPIPVVRLTFPGPEPRSPLSAEVSSWKSSTTSLKEGCMPS